MQTGTLSLSLLLTAIANKISLKTVDYAVFSIVGMRAAVTLLTLHFVRNGVEGFELIDSKLLSDSIPFIGVQCFVAVCISWKRDLLISAPITIITTILVTRQAYSVDDVDMSCFIVPEL